MKRICKSLYIRYGLVYIIPLLVISIILSYIIYRQDANSFLAVMRNNEKQVLDFQGSLIVSNLKTLEDDISYLHSLSFTRNYVESGFDDSIKLDSVYGSFLKRKKIYSGISIVDKTGIEHFGIEYDGEEVRTRDSGENRLNSNSLHFNKIINTPSNEIFYSPFEFSYDSSAREQNFQPVLRIARTFENNEGKNTSFIIISYSGINVLDILENISSYSFGKTFLLNDFNWIVSADNVSTPEKTKTLNFLKSSEGESFLSKEENQKDYSSGFFTYKRIRIFSGDHSPEWALLSFVDESEIKEHTAESIKLGLTLFSALSLLSIGLGIYFAKLRVMRIIINNDISERARIFDFNPAPVMKTTHDGTILSSNRAARNIFNLYSETKSLNEVFSDTDRPDLKKLEETGIINFEHRVSDSTYFFTCIADNSTGNIYFYGSDISENSRIREELANFKIAVKQSANVIVFTDLEGRILFANDAFERITGYKPEEVLGEKPKVLNSGYHSDSFYRELWETIESGRVWNGEFYNKRKDRTYFWEKATITPVLDEENVPKFYIAVKEDITEKKKIEADLQTQTQYAEQARITAEKAKIEAESANLMKSTFLANMSHEIRTPMNAILGFTRLLLDNDQPKENMEMLEIILNSGENLLALINDILDFSKIEANEIEINDTRINLQNFFESIEDLFLIQTKQKGIDFRIQLKTEIPETVMGDENRLRQVLINIIGNAVKFTDSGSIAVDVFWQENNLVIKVKDTGIGIEEDKLEEIFSPFKQSDSSIDRKYEGTGLGLAISTRLTHLMKGRLEVESEHGKGSTFTLNIPLINCSEEEAFCVDEQEGYHGPDYGEIVEHWLDKVSDDPALRDIIKDALTALPRHLDRLEKAVRSRNRTDIQAIAHELAGSTGNLGMSELYEPMKELNSGLRDNSLKDNQIEKIFNRIEKIIKGIPEEYITESAAELLPIEGDRIDISVLTADDSLVNRKLIGAMLSTVYISTDFAEDGFQVLEMLQNKKYDILLLDIQMPKLDGMETIKKIRENSEYNNLYVIAVTANAMKGDAKKYLDSGCNDYISKPIKKDIFLKKIEYQVQRIKSSIDTGNSPDTRECREIIDLLEKEMKIFNPGRVRVIAEKLGTYSSDRQTSILVRKIKEAADSFDSQALSAIIVELKEMAEIET